MNKARPSLCLYESTSCIPQCICLRSKLIFFSNPCYISYLQYFLLIFPIYFSPPQYLLLPPESHNSVTFVTHRLSYGIQVTRRLIIQPSPSHSYLLAVLSENSSEHISVRHSQCELPRFTLPQDIVCYCTFIYFNRHGFRNERVGQKFLKWMVAVITHI
jgi:hypothetical protein